jgi:hypothetical protein
MRGRFLGLDTGKLADYYERGDPILGEFLCSWDQLEKLFSADLRADRVSREAQFVALLRSLGFDRTLRAGQSMSTVIVSRSRRHGLQIGQACLSFDVGKYDVRLRVGPPVYSIGTSTDGPEGEVFPLPETATILPLEVVAALRRLESEPIT